jgi:cell division protease FtsH
MAAAGRDRRSSKQLGRFGGIMSFGKSKAKVYDEDRPHTRFAGIAGYEGSKADVMK